MNDQLLQQAVRLHRSGRLAEAHAIYTQLVDSGAADARIVLVGLAGDSVILGPADRVALRAADPLGNEQIAATIDVTVVFPSEDPEAEPEEERFTETRLWRTIGDVGLLSIRTDTLEETVGLIDQLELFAGSDG